MAVDCTPDVTDTQALTYHLPNTRPHVNGMNEGKRLNIYLKLNVPTLHEQKKMGNLKAQNYTPMHNMQPNSEL